MSKEHMLEEENHAGDMYEIVSTDEGIKLTRSVYVGHETDSLTVVDLVDAAFGIANFKRRAQGVPMDSTVADAVEHLRRAKVALVHSQDFETAAEVREIAQRLRTKETP